MIPKGVDCHMHMVLDGVNWKSAIARHSNGADTAWIRSILAQYAREGFTYLRDGGDRWGVGARARELAAEYGILYRTPLAPLSKTGHYGGFIGLQFDDMGHYARLAAQNKAQGADFIKIMISGLMDFDHFGRLTQPGLDPAEIREMIHIAHEEGMAVMAHANGSETVRAAALAGVDSVEHGAYLDEESLWAMKEAGTVWVPTLSTVANLRGRDRFCHEAVCAITESALENILCFAAMGGLLAPGSDAGAWAVPHSIHSEYALLYGLLGEETDTVLERGIRRIQEIF